MGLYKLRVCIRCVKIQRSWPFPSKTLGIVVNQNPGDDEVTGVCRNLILVALKPVVFAVTPRLPTSREPRHLMRIVAALYFGMVFWGVWGRSECHAQNRYPSVTQIMEQHDDDQDG